MPFFAQAFNPRTFLPPGAKISRAKMSSMVALGSDDRNISVWLNNRQAPLVVIKEVFDGQIYDLTW
jgi:protein HIRA/HIR1